MQIIRLALSFTVVATAAAAPGDVPQWRGENRDGVFTAKGLAAEWPVDGPALAWKAEKLGKGMSGISIVDGKLFTTSGRKGGQFIVALDLKTRAEVWAAPLSSKGGEPRCTPTVDGGLVYAVSTEGDLVCVKAGDGSEVWRKSFADDFGNPRKPTWQFSESPLVDGNQLIVCPGSSEATMAALDKKTGAVIWKTATTLAGKGHDGAGYTGAVVSNAAGTRQYVTMAGKGALGVDAKTGKLLWHYNRVANGTAVIPTPLVWGDEIFVSSGYGTGAALLKIAKAPAPAAGAPKVDEKKVTELTAKLETLKKEIEQRREARANAKGDAREAADQRVQEMKPAIEKAERELAAASGESGEDGPSRVPGSPLIAEEVYWLNAGVFENHHGGMVRLGDYIYAGKGHNNGFPICIEWKTGKVAWTSRGPGSASAAVIAADGHLYFRYENGVMALIEAKPDGYKAKGSFKLASVAGPSWPHPAIHDGNLYVRDQDVLMCYRLAGK